LRILLPAILFLCWPSGSKAAPIQSCNIAFFSSGTVQCTLNGVGSNHALILSVVTFSSACDTTIISDTFGFSWGSAEVTHQCTPFSGNQLTINIYCARTQGSSGNDTFTETASGAGGYLIVTEYPNVLGSGLTCTPDGFNSAGNTTAGPITEGSITTTNATDLLIATGWYVGTANAGLTTPASYTQEVYYNTCSGCSNQVAHMFSDRSPGSTGTFSPTFTMATTGTWLGIQVAFTPANPPPAKHRSSIL